MYGGTAKYIFRSQRQKGGLMQAIILEFPNYLELQYVILSIWNFVNLKHSQAVS